MSFAHYFKLSSYCMIAAGFMAVAASGSIDPVAIALFSSAMIASWFVDTVRLREKIPVWVLNCLALSCIPIGALDYRYASHSLIISIIHMVLFLAALKLLTCSSDGDFVFLYLISFAELLAASILTVDITIFACFFLFLTSSVSTLVLFEMRRSNAATLKRSRIQLIFMPKGKTVSGWELFTPFPAATVSAMIAAMTLMVLLLAVPLFLLLPRVSLGSASRPSGRTQLISGFSEKVQLGAIGTIKQSDAVVMRVRVSQPPQRLPGNLKWRGIALDRYDGRTWSRSRPWGRPVPAQGRYYKLEESTQGTELLWQTFYLEALSTNVIFAGRTTLAVSNDLDTLQRDDSDNLYTSPHPRKKIRYLAVSDPSAPDPSPGAVLGPIPQEIADTCLQLPFLDPRIAELAHKATDAVAKPYAKARALEFHLKNNYSYSLDLSGTPNSSDPIAMFLFELRKGHCEYFASAMVVMLRELGIPARLINGFRTGDYNNLGDVWTVRQYHAHSWVEAYFGPYGWIEFDPTPTDGQHPRTGLAAVFSDFMDAMGLLWWEDVINYDFSKQYQLIGSVRTWLDQQQRQMGTAALAALAKLEVGLKSAFAEAGPDESRWKEWSVSGLALAALAFLIIRKKRGAVRQLSRSLRLKWHILEPMGAVAEFYRDALALLENHGMKIARGQTALEFAESLNPHPAAIPMTALTHLYNRIRFGPPDLSVEPEAARIHLQRLRGAFPKGT
jgi:transglutaminase-like putative cysteine protease